MQVHAIILATRRMKFVADILGLIRQEVNNKSGTKQTNTCDEKKKFGWKDI